MAILFIFQNVIFSMKYNYETKYNKRGSTLTIETSAFEFGVLKLLLISHHMLILRNKVYYLTFLEKAGYLTSLFIFTLKQIEPVFQISLLN